MSEFMPCHENLSMETPAICTSCEWSGTVGEILMVSDPGEVLHPGETIPIGTCPECRACLYLEESKHE